jgi:hypothetical protein
MWIAFSAAANGLWRRRTSALGNAHLGARAQWPRDRPVLDLPKPHQRTGLALGLTGGIDSWLRPLSSMARVGADLPLSKSMGLTGCRDGGAIASLPLSSARLWVGYYRPLAPAAAEYPPIKCDGKNHRQRHLRGPRPLTGLGDKAGKANDRPNLMVAMLDQQQAWGREWRELGAQQSNSLLLGESRYGRAADHPGVLSAIVFQHHLWLLGRYINALDEDLAIG